jgi:hypothetical protein
MKVQFCVPVLSCKQTRKLLFLYVKKGKVKMLIRIRAPNADLLLFFSGGEKASVPVFGTLARWHAGASHINNSRI